MWRGLFNCMIVSSPQESREILGGGGQDMEAGRLEGDVTHVMSFVLSRERKLNDGGMEIG